MPQQTIDNVITRLDAIIARCYERGSRLGFFPAMYRKTTLEVRKGLENDRFEDPDRLERLDVVFAERYFHAFEQYEEGKTPTRSWSYAFRMTRSHRPSVIQHLLLGMNAHINLDLGISAARVAPGDDLPALKHDFDEINAILGELIDRVQNDLAGEFPAVRALDALGGTLDEKALHFSIRKARASAWHKAEALARLPADTDPTENIRAFDREVARFARVICPPRRINFPVIAHLQKGSPERIRRVIDALTT